MKLGLNLGYWGIGPRGDEALEIVKAAESAGFDSVWAAESYGSDVVSVLAWLAPQTETIQLGAAIMQVPARAPAAAAMAGCTIDALSGGRFIFGFGPSGPQVSEGWYGVPYAKPWGRTREYVEIVRKVVAREDRLEYDGEHFKLPLPDGEGKALKLNFHPVRNHIPIFLASKKVADEAGPDFRDTIEKVQGNLTLPVIQELNSEVDIDKKEPAAVAHNYLVQSGYIK